ncbi:OmpA family protein [Kordia sp.]|uniref:OmpA family protein n=1 Tax=Kordia sp. TaxID=1965332 RepID=UPI003D2A1B22
MKQYYTFITLLLAALWTQSSFSQDTDKSWYIEAGVSAIDLYPVGEDMPQGEFLDEFINLNDHWNFGYYLGVSRNLTNNLSLSARGTVSEITKYGDFGIVDESVLVDNLKYYGLDAMLNYSFGNRKLQPFVAVGGGYSWLEEGPFNTSGSTSGDLIGAGTVNGSIGLNYWISDKFALKLQTTYKHSFKDYLPKHWNHNLGISYRLGKMEDTTTEPNPVSVKNSPWSFEAGLSAVNFYPVGEDAPQGDYFDEFFNLNDHWNMGFYVAVTRNLTDNLSVTGKTTFQQISKYGEFGEMDESVLVDNLKYYGLDGMVNYSFGQGKLQPFVAVGGGYTWLEEGTYNTSSATSGDLIGAGTANGSVGVKYWFSDRIGINLQSTYKHSFKDYLPKHFDHNLGLVYRIGTSEPAAEEDNDRDGDGIPDELDLCPDTFGIAEFGGCPDTDGDGVADKDDLCPEIKGLIEFGGCPDTDGDGFPDNKDKCPTVKGTDEGCPATIVETVIETVVDSAVGERKVYFNTDSTKLDLNAKETLDAIAANLKSDTTYNISIEGHADSRGTNNYNDKLSLARAQAIKTYLDSKNLTNSNITISGKGETEPIATNNTAAGRALNRRVELIINITAK